MEDEEEFEVMSEVHLGCPPDSHEAESSRFHKLFICESSPSNDQSIALDEDGDLVLPRRRSRFAHSFTLTIQHSITSTLRDVGLQVSLSPSPFPCIHDAYVSCGCVWKAELVLSDFVLHKMCTSSDFDGTVSLEIGCGTGLVGILLARVAKVVFLTDYGDEILDNCAQNVKINSPLLNPLAVVNVRELDWMGQWPLQNSLSDCKDPKRYSWSSLDLEQVKSATFVYAADVIYKDDLTVALFSKIERLMSMGSKKVLYLALEKRYNFSMDEMEVVANGYACFRRNVREGQEEETKEAKLVGKRIDITEIPQYVKGYERGQDVELWEIRSAS
ncbi:PREDICTED: methyltransferase-like protein 22 isoform X2 [Tarenaya hassleriana]|uniref:methyltransferase-like protein 22 isoform X2 n=1 Tax=Tarenaya hassleriana TaxID=28532 RepID=UPI00053C8537|nr:PREDICTED: methyltransferase-like protein 22 isoform X2 [Tarenaya hassleriana]